MATPHSDDKPAASLTDRIERAFDGRRSYDDGPIALRSFAGHVDHVERLGRPLRVAHITDQHVGRVTPWKVQQRAVEMANASKPDLVALTGDFVAHSHAYLDQLEELIASFEAPVFAVLGNHDHWSGAAEVRRSLLRGGAEILDNANTQITLYNERVQVVGVDDAYTGHSDVDKAVKGLDRKLPTLGLSHIAEVADKMWRFGVPLVLSGHTHAGQITVARLHEFALGRLAGHKYVHGLYGCRAAERHQGAVYVGAGIGASVMPLRFGERGKREVTVFELGAAPGDFTEHHVEQPAHNGRVPSEELKQKRHVQAKKKAARRMAKAQKKNERGGTKKKQATDNKRREQQSVKKPRK
jgi:predicted MPP superfamily phosphohydrolase